MRVKVIVDKNVCIGSGNCMVIASENFTFNAEGKAEVISSQKKRGTEMILEGDKAQIKKLLAAANACPVQAIRILNEEGKEIS